MEEQQELLTSIEAKLRENFGDNVISTEMMRDFPVFTIKRDKIVEVIKYLYDEPEMELPRVGCVSKFN